MFSTWARGRRWLGYAGLTLLAVAGQLVFNEAVATIIRSQGKPWTILTPQYDFLPIWTPTYLFLSGQAVPHWYGIGISNAWPPPHEVLLAPFGLLPYQAAHVASMLATAALMVFTVGLGTKVDKPVMEQFAKVSGGQVFYATNEMQLSNQFHQVVEGLRRRYVLSYVSTNSNHNGAWRKVELRSRAKSVHVRSRDGYYAPPQ